MRGILIKNAVAVDSKSAWECDIRIANGRIQAMGLGLSPTREEDVLDAGGKYVIPGAVDGHTHMMDPGYTDREEFATGTAAAAYGGVTTVVDHHRTVPAVYDAEILREKIDYLSTRSVVDFGLMGGISPENTAALEAMWREGITGFKTFVCNLHGVKAMYAGYLDRAFREIASFGGVVLIHCEDDSLAAENEERLRRAGRTDPLSHVEWRSPLVEELAVEMVLKLAGETGVTVNIAHVSQPGLLRRIRAAQEAGCKVFAECCPHYFHLSTDDLAERGPWVKFTPPVKPPEVLDEMWALFDSGYITTIGSDHCPYPKAEKEKGLENIWNAPNGIPGVEHSVRLMLDGVSRGKTSLHRVVEAMCENPAKLYGLSHRKGFLRVGMDADLLVLDMDRRETLTNDRVVSKCGWTPYHGKEIRGVPETVLVRGKVVAADGKVTAEAGWGEFIRRR